jgi:2-polyprenyl-6-methoxyphenol hydroxylase-like FAD-dependent oxidoreductase
MEFSRPFDCVIQLDDKVIRVTDKKRVLIVGAGIGGLCLAQGLKRAGVDVAVYERNRARTDWLQGYRIHISPHGSRSLHECLAPELWEAFVATAGSPTAGFGFLDEQLKQLLFMDGELIGAAGAGPEESHHAISRITLRQVLLAGLDDVVRFDKEFTGYERTPDGRVTASFADGTSATGDVLVAADGANSRERGQYLPGARRIDTGVTNVVGKLPLNEETRAWLPARLTSSVNNVMPPGPCSMFVALWEGDRQRQAAVPAGIGGNDEAAELHPGMLFDNTQDYLFWGLAGRTGAYPAGALERADGAELRGVVGELIRGWHPGLRRLVAESDASTVAPVAIRSMAPVEPWQTTNVTLIGDAIHNMTPMAGIGANTALRDASLLCRKLVAVDRGEAELLPAIHEYESAMLDYGFAAVRLSLRNARQAVDGNPLSRGAFRAMLRLVDALPPLKRQMARGFGQ